MPIEDNKTEAGAELERLNKVLEVAKRNGNKLFIENIEREIEAVQPAGGCPAGKSDGIGEGRKGRTPSHVVVEDEAVSGEVAGERSELEFGAVGAENLAFCHGEGPAAKRAQIVATESGRSEKVLDADIADTGVAKGRLDGGSLEGPLG